MRQATLRRAVGMGVDMANRSTSDEPGLHGFESPPKLRQRVSLGIPLDLVLPPARTLAHRDDAFPHRRLRALVELRFHGTEGLDQAGFFPGIGAALKPLQLLEDAFEVSVHGNLQGRRGPHLEVTGRLIDFAGSSGWHAGQRSTHEGRAAL